MSINISLPMILLFSVIQGSIALAETHAIVVGAEKYLYVNQLKGSDADARDIATALQRRGVADVTLLIDDQATRDHLWSAFDQMIGRVKSDDLVVIAFAGHGSEEVWGKVHPPGVTEGQHHEVFLLPGVVLPNSAGQIDPSMKEAARERIMGSEIAARLARLSAKGARTIFVADTCHGGGLTREPIREELGHEISVRTLHPYRFADKQDPLNDLYTDMAAPIDTDSQLANLTFLAGADKDHLVPEVSIPRGSTTYRGALSYAFARAIDGTAQTADPNLVTRGELQDFVTATVRSQVNNDQDPDLRPRSDFNRLVIDFARDMPRGGAPVKPQDTVVSTVVDFMTLGSDSVHLPSRQSGSVILRQTMSKDQSDFTFDPATHSAHSSLGDLIASDVGPADLPGVAAREVAQRRLLALSLARPREIRLGDGDKRYVFGDKIVIDPGRSSGPEYYLIFNIAGTGIVQFLYPYTDQGDPAVLPQDNPFSQVDVRPPYGTDLLVLLTSPKPLDPLIAEIRKLHNRSAAIEAVDLVERALTPETHIGLQQIFTAPRM